MSESEIMRKLGVVMACLAFVFPVVAIALCNIHKVHLVDRALTYATFASMLIAYLCSLTKGIMSRDRVVILIKLHLLKVPLYIGGWIVFVVFVGLKAAERWGLPVEMFD